MTLTIERPNPNPSSGNRPSRRSLRALRWVGLGGAVVMLVGGAVVAWSHRSTKADIADYEERVVALAAEAGAVPFDGSDLAALPEPVQRWIDFTFDDPSAADPSYIEFDMEGDFRRPLTEGFNPLSGNNVIATNEPALVFSGTTSIIPGFWALAYDAYVEGEMEMKAKVLSTITVVDERETPDLNRTSLQRWLLLSPMYPTSLLPGGPVTWESVDADHARASIQAHGYEASLLFTFGEAGSITRIDAEQDGDLTTPYHGAGEHLAVSEYQNVAGVRLPLRFVVARAAGGETFPFLDAVVTRYVAYP